MTQDAPLTDYNIGWSAARLMQRLKPANWSDESECGYRDGWRFFHGEDDGALLRMRDMLYTLYQCGPAGDENKKLFCDSGFAAGWEAALNVALVAFDGALRTQARRRVAIQRGYRFVVRAHDTNPNRQAVDLVSPEQALVASIYPGRTQASLRIISKYLPDDPRYSVEYSNDSAEIRVTFGK